VSAVWCWCGCVGVLRTESMLFGGTVVGLSSDACACARRYSLGASWTVSHTSEFSLCVQNLCVHSSRRFRGTFVADRTSASSRPPRGPMGTSRLALLALLPAAAGALQLSNVGVRSMEFPAGRASSSEVVPLTSLVGSEGAVLFAVRRPG
jgi:hypothetical protein